jgi:hypothetical protein
MPAKGSSKQAEPREIPPALIVVAIVLIVLAVGTGGYYAYNGGWQSDSQKDAQAKHEFIPIMAAKHGDMEPLQAENRLRQALGQAPLVVPKDKKMTSPNDPAALADLQRRMGGK